MNFLKFICAFCLFASPSLGRKHELVLEGDTRKYFSITTFGFFSGGELEVKLNYLTFFAKHDGYFGLTLTKTISDNITPYMEGHQNECLLSESEDENVEIVSFFLNPKNKELHANCSRLSGSLEIQPVIEPNSSSSKVPILGDVKKQNKNNRADSQNAAQQLIKVKRAAEEKEILEKNDEVKVEGADTNVPDVKDQAEVVISPKSAEKSGSDVTLTTHSVPKGCGASSLSYKNDVVANIRRIYDLKFIVYIKNTKAEGLYSLFFHNCGGLKETPIPVNLSVSITEKNLNSYLSAGEIPLPKLYFLMSLTFFITGCIWVSFLRRKKEEVFKIHYLMGLLVFVKSLSLLFHGINFHIIAKDGYPMEAWAVLYYITHLLKGALLFITIVLIGTGWAFIKPILSDKDKKIFMIVIPLQVLANVAKIIMEESEVGNTIHYTWREIFILVDLVCCGAIMFPVVWSIRHLQEASHIDGKAAINLEKLKLFRHFYVMIVCYIYFTRIIVYLLQITVPFYFEWVDDVFRETATLTFFILTGYNFRPTTNNPYFRLSQDDDLEMGEVLTQTGFTEAATKTVRSREASKAKDENNTTTKRESSHEYD